MGPAASSQSQGQPLAYSRFLCSDCILCFVCILLQVCIRGWDCILGFGCILYHVIWPYASNLNLDKSFILMRSPCHHGCPSTPVRSHFHSPLVQAVAADQTTRPRTRRAFWLCRILQRTSLVSRTCIFSLNWALGRFSL